jgi:cellulose synthase/poly-beta-1,6-N-acetylglucosamine synthase-like glycosyltransferase
VIFLVIAGVVLALLALPGTLELLMLTVAGLLPARRYEPRISGILRLAVVVPAHNEELNIARCVSSLYACSRTGVELDVFVIADNCTDVTAEVAAQAGANALVRQNAELRGKGFALEFAFRTLLPKGYKAFVVVDADSEVSSNFIERMASAFRAGADAAQCRYMVRNACESVRARLMNVALYGFNVLRPRGRDRLGLSSGIYGNGFALSADTLTEVPYTAASVVEDLEYHLNLVRAGRRVRFIDDAAVYGDMPVAGTGAKTQRARWEGGRLRMLVENVPVLLLELVRGRLALLEPLLDLLLLPLAFHLILLLCAVVTPSSVARALGAAGIAVVLLHLLGAIRVGGGSAKDLAILATAPFYVIWKVLLIPKLISTSRSGAAWIRTERVPKEKLL